MASEDDYKPTKSEQKKEDWMNSKWRPMMGWMYMIVCFMDFVGFPILWSLLQAYDHGQVTSQWQPLTLQGAGLFHLAMGAVIGISAYGRTQEKLGGAAGPTMQFPQGAGTTYIPPGQGQAIVSNQPMGGGMSGGFGGSSNGFNSSSSGSSAFGSASSGGFGSSGGGFGSAPASGGFGSSSSSGTGAFGASAPSNNTGFGPAPTVTASGVGAPTPAAGSKPIGPAAAAFPPI